MFWYRISRAHQGLPPRLGQLREPRASKALALRCQLLALALRTTRGEYLSQLRYRYRSVDISANTDIHVDVGVDVDMSINMNGCLPRFGVLFVVGI